MTAALSDLLLDQIFRTARTFNGWADRAVADANVREIYDHEMGADVCELQPRPFRCGCVAPT